MWYWTGTRRVYLFEYKIDVNIIFLLWQSSFDRYYYLPNVTKLRYYHPTFSLLSSSLFLTKSVTLQVWPGFGYQSHFWPEDYYIAKLWVKNFTRFIFYFQQLFFFVFLNLREIIYWSTETLKNSIINCQLCVIFNRRQRH